MRPFGSESGVYMGSVMLSMGQVAERYLAGRDCSKAHAANVRRTARKMDAAGISPATINGECVSIWLTSMRDSGLRPTTVKSERVTALSLWRFGIDEGLILAPIRKVFKPRVTGRVTRAFTRTQCSDLVKRLFSLDLGEFQSGCPKNLWLRTWVAYVYETGARFTDAYELLSEALLDDGVAWVASKTGRPVFKRISKETRALVQELVDRSPDGTVFRWAVSRRWAFATIREAFKELGLPQGRTQWLRRSGATHVEMIRPGAAREYLCHTDGGALAARHYIDMTQLMDQAPAPISLVQESDLKTLDVR